ncbi:MAG: O-antigen polysaccharide polymerase Wzy [Bacteroidales bacterium]|nr:O-antigen polysaccharide polymerase Wzy [Bacteroidales bacterium]
MLAPIIFFRDFDYQQSKGLFYMIALAYILLFLFIGDRGPALFLIVILTGLSYAFLYIRKIPIKYLLVFGIVGIILMHLIGMGRTTDIRDARENIITRGIEKTRTTDQSQFYYAITKSMVANNRNLYVGLEYVDKNGINWGETYLPSIVGVIPFAQSIVEYLLEKNFESSADFFTTLTLGEQRSTGLGTNLVADVYITFGLIGVIALFLLFGWIVELFRKRTIIINDIYSNIVYFTLLSFSVAYTRIGLFSPLKFIIWTFVIYYLLKQFNLLKNKPIK